LDKKIDRIEQETERLNELVGQSLTLSRLDAGAVYAKDDFIDVGKLLQNIISDCDFEASEQNKSVNLKVLSQQDKNNLKITIADQGPGIPEDKISGLFEPFVRLSEARDRDSGGYGLGLAIAKRAIEFHQGQICAKNNTDKGLLVEIVLPVNR